MTTEFNFKLKAGLAGLGCSALSFSALAVPPITKRKLNSQFVSRIIAGAETFDSTEDALDFLEVVNTMEYIQRTVQPRVPVNWSNVLELKDVLKTVHEQRKDETNPLHRQCWYVRLSRLNFFQRLRNGSVIETINPEKDGAAFTDYQLAGEVVKRLSQQNVPAKLELLTGHRRQSTICTSLEELGFETTAAIGGTDGTTDNQAS